MDPLPDDVIDAIADLRNYGLSQRKTTEMVKASRGSIKNYEPEGCETDDTLSVEDVDVDEVLSDHIDLEVALEPEYIPGVENTSSREWSSADPDASPYMTDNEADSRLENDYSGEDPGEFIEGFFEDFEVGVKQDFVRIQRRRADRRNGIPSPDKLKNDLHEMSSGVANSKEIEYIIEEYWAEAQRYITHNQHRGVSLLSMSDSPGQNPQQQQNGGPQWYTMSNGNQQYGMFVQTPNGQSFVQKQPPSQAQGQMGMGQNAPNQGGVDNDVRRELRELREEVQSARKQGQQSDTLSSTLNEVKKYKQMLAELEELNGGGNESDQMIAALRQEIQSLKQQVAGNPAPSSSDPREAMLMQMVQSGQADPSEAMKVLKDMSGENDPKVREKEIEKEMELEKLRQKRNRAETLVESLSGVAEQIGEGFAKVMADRAEGQAQQPGRQQPYQGGMGQQMPQQTQQFNGMQTQQTQQAQQPSPQQSATPEPQNQSVSEWDCNHCGATTEQDTSTPGVECSECDKSVIPCPQCHDPVEIPAFDAPTSYECPDCEGVISDIYPDDDMAVCPHCSWGGEIEETGGEVCVCANCGFTDAVKRDDPLAEVDV